jgi:hypothetical protein
MAITPQVKDPNQANKGDYGINNYNPLIIKDLVSNVVDLRPATSTVVISNGWGNTRLRFELIARVVFGSGDTYDYHFQGYTNYLDTSFTGKLDPNMELIINSERRVKVFSAGVQQSSFISGDQYLISSGENTRSIRPKDIFSSIQCSQIAYGESFSGDENYLDVTSSLGKSPTLSNRVNTSPGAYVSSLINAAVCGNMYTNNDDEREEWAMDKSAGLSSSGNQAAIAVAGEHTYYVSPFIERIQHEQTHLNAGIKLGELYRMDPSLESKIQYVPNPSPIESAYMDGNNNEDMIASTISTQTSALMTRTGLTGIAFTATNFTTDGSNSLDVSDASPININSDGVYEAQEFMRLFDIEVMPFASQNGLIPFAVDVFANIYSNIKVDITLNPTVGKVPYVFPVFADSLYSPLVTDNADNNIADVITNLASDLSRIKMDTAGQQNTNQQPMSMQGSDGLYL